MAFLVREGSTQGGLDDNTLGAEDNFHQSERLSSGARSRFQGLGWSEVRGLGAKVR